MAEQETIGSGYLYPSKPFNVLNPTGVSPEQSVEVFNQQKMQRTQLGFQAGENDKDRMVQSEEKERDRQHDALMGDKQLAAGQELQRQQQEAQAAAEEKQRLYEAGENEKTRELQKKSMEDARSAEDRRFKQDQDDETYRRQMEHTTMKMELGLRQEQKLREEFQLNNQLSDFEVTNEFESKYHNLSIEQGVLERKATVLSVASEILKRAQSPEEALALTQSIKDNMAADMSLTDNALPVIESAIYNMKTAPKPEEPGFLSSTFRGSAGIKDTDAGAQLNTKEWEGLASAIASTALTGEIKTAEGMPAQDYVTSKLARMMWALDKAEGKDRAMMMQIAADEYGQLAGSGANMRNIDKHLHLAYQLLGGEGPGTGTMDLAARGQAAQQTGMTPDAAEGLFDGKKKASSLARALQLADPKTNKRLVSNWYGSEVMFEEKMVNGQKVRVLKNTVDEKITKSLMELFSDQEFAGMSTTLLEGAIDDDPNTAPEFARMMSTLPPKAQEQVKTYVWSVKERIDAAYNKDRTAFNTSEEPGGRPWNMSRVQEERQTLESKKAALDREKAGAIGSKREQNVKGYSSKKSTLAEELDAILEGRYTGD